MAAIAIASHTRGSALPPNSAEHQGFCAVASGAPDKTLSLSPMLICGAFRLDRRHQRHHVGIVRRNGERIGAFGARFAVIAHLMKR